MCILFARYMPMAFIRTSFYRLFLHWCIFNPYSLYWACTFVIASAKEWLQKHKRSNRRGILLFTLSYIVFHRSILVYSTLQSRKTWTQNKVDWYSYRCKTSAKYSRFRYDGWSGEMASPTTRGLQTDGSNVRVRMPTWVPSWYLEVPTILWRKGEEDYFPETSCTY